MLRRATGNRQQIAIDILCITSETPGAGGRRRLPTRTDKAYKLRNVSSLTGQFIHRLKHPVGALDVVQLLSKGLHPLLVLLLGDRLPRFFKVLRVNQLIMLIHINVVSCHACFKQRTDKLPLEKRASQSTDPAWPYCWVISRARLRPRFVQEKTEQVLARYFFWG